jgi:hypothetical protein
MVHFRMEVEHIALNRDSSPEVKFDIAFTHRALTDTLNASNVGDPIWFLVDSVINEHVGTCSNDRATCTIELESSLKRQLEPTVTPVLKRARKSVRFVPPMQLPLPDPCLPPLAINPIICKDFIGFNFCDLLRRRFRQPLQANACVVLEDTAQCKHLVYPSHFTASSQPRKPTSLGQLIKPPTAPESVGGIFLLDRIALAKMLAIAVLQYHATPWLQLSWRSNDILFFDIEQDSRLQKRPDLSAPYLNARIQGKSSPRLAQHHSNMSRNPILFSLGVVLLELAHGATLETLTLPCDADNGQLHREFFTARRLAKAKRTVMGVIYNDIVEQLVECVFPCGGDLGNPELQATFYEDVICPLDELEQGFRKLYIGGDGS